MTVIEASSAGVRDMADGSLRITLEFEPRHARDAYALFGSRGTPVAVAALKPASSKAEPSERPAIGELGRWAAIRCTEEPFRVWLADAHGSLWGRIRGDDETLTAEEVAAEMVRRLCHVTSRRDIDTNPEAFDKFHRLIRQPYAAWLKANPQ